MLELCNSAIGAIAAVFFGADFSKMILSKSKYTYIVILILETQITK